MKDIRTHKKRIQVGFRGIANDVDQSVMSHEYAKSCTNFLFEDGALTGAFGIDSASGYYAYPNNSRHTFPTFSSGTVIKKTFVFRHKTNGVVDDRIVAHLSNGSCYSTKIMSNEDWTALTGVSISGDAQAVNYNYNGEDILLLSSATNPLYMIKDSGNVACNDAPRFSSIAIHSERVFGGLNGESTQVWFSDDFNPTNWTISSSEAGFINFADGMGDVIKLVSFLNYLYIFRDYGIYRLTAYGDQSEFVLKKVFSDTGRIYKDTIVMCGDRIMFCAENNLYVFDGYDVTRISQRLPHIYNPRNVCAEYVDGRYYLACRINYAGNINDSVVVYDTRQKNLSVITCSLRWLMAMFTQRAEDLICVFEDTNKTHRLGMFSKSGKMLDTPLTKTYQSPYNNLLSDKVKTLRSVSFVSKSPITLNILLDGQSYQFDIEGKENLQTVHIEKSGKEFGLNITSNSASCYITPMIVDMDVKAV